MQEQIIDPALALEIVRNDADTIAFDTETNGLEFNSIPVGYVITNRDYSIYVPLRHEGGGNVPDAEGFERALNDAFAERGALGYRTVGHNLGFDLRMCLKQNVVLQSPLEDTMINESLIDDLTVGYGLDDCSIRRRVTVKKGDELYRLLAETFGGIPDRKQMAHFWRLPGDHPIVVDYATGDGISTLELWEAQQPILDAEELRVPWQLECDLLPYLARAHVRGVKIDMEAAPTVLKGVKDAIDEGSAKFPPGFSVMSPKDLEALYRANGFTDADFARTETGKPQFNEKFLETNDIGTAILDIRRLRKCESSFIAPLIDTNNYNGRVHPTLNQSKTDEFGVAGARLSCSGPNLQAFPKRNKTIGKIVRQLVIPDEGFLLYEADFSQQEPRLFTHYSEEPALVEGYNNNTIDIHDRASEALGLERDIAKRLGLGMLTMMGIKALAGHMRWPYGQARDAHRAFLTDAFPQIGKFQELAVETFKRRGYVKSILGRRARMSQVKYAYQAVSRIIQNGGGDHMKSALLVAFKHEDANPNDLQVLLSIHDSIIVQCRVGKEHLLKAMVDEIDTVASRPPMSLIVPIPMEVVGGTNWTEASYGPKIKNVKTGWIESWRDLTLAA